MMDRCLSKFLSLALSCIAAFSVQAGTMWPHEKQTLYYIAGNLGIFQGNFNTTYSDLTDVIAQNISETYSQMSYEGGIAVGILKSFHQNYLIGIEVLANFNMGKDAIFQAGANSTAFTDKTSIKNYIDIILKPGLMLAPDLISYLNLGVSVVRVSDRLTSPLDSTPIYQVVNQNKWTPGADLGIGLKKFLSSHWSIFAEYNYHDYGTVSFDNFMNYTADYSHTTRITSNVFSVGTAWNC